MRNLLKLTPVAAALILASFGPAGAQTFGSTAQQTMQVSATVTGTCTLTAPSLAFATFKGNETGSFSTNGNFAIGCPTGVTVPFAIGIANGNYNATTGRYLAATGATTSISYKLLCPGTANCSTGWGNTTNTWYTGSTGSTGSTTVQVTAQITALPSGLTPGNYTDTVTATLNY